MKDEFKRSFKKYIPENSHDLFFKIIDSEKFNLKITKARSTKLADFRPALNDGFPSISINYNLNHYAFLITFLHEFAHLLVWKDFKRTVNPHGPEWRSAYYQLIKPFIDAKILPDDIETALQNHLYKPGASTCRDIELTKILNLYNPLDQVTYLSDLPDNAMFKLSNGMAFQRGKKRRTRYKCVCLDNSRTYLVSEIAQVEALS